MDGQRRAKKVCRAWPVAAGPYGETRPQVFDLSYMNGGAEVARD